MSEDRQRILTMLADGKISVDEAERLLAALENKEVRPEDIDVSESKVKAPKFLCVTVNPDSNGKDGRERVNIKIPLGLVKAGIGLSSLLPDSAKAKVNAALGDKGIDLDLKNVDPKAVGEFMKEIRDLDITVEDGQDNVRIYCK
jgi:hypothetical protein